jgi:REP element-mobilizing transposase RayT
MKEIRLRAPRLEGFAYDTPGAYFVTTCTFRREAILGEVSSNGVANLSVPGQITRDTWESLTKRYPGIATDTFIVMPDHFHGILWLGESEYVGAALAPPSPTLSKVVRTFKSISARQINSRTDRLGGRVWQRSFYDRVIRIESELDAAREYIANNPMALALDRQVVAR